MRSAGTARHLDSKAQSRVTVRSNSFTTDVIHTKGNPFYELGARMSRTGENFSGLLRGPLWPRMLHGGERGLAPLPPPSIGPRSLSGSSTPHERVVRSCPCCSPFLIMPITCESCLMSCSSPHQDTYSLLGARSGTAFVRRACSALLLRPLGPEVRWCRTLIVVI